MRLFFNSLNSSSSNPTVPVYILAGQSNSNGEGEVGGAEGALPLDLQNLTGVYILNNQTSNTYELLSYSSTGANQKDNPSSGRPNGIGQEMKLGQLLSGFHSQDVFFIKEATGSQKIADGGTWHPSPQGARWTSLTSKLNFSRQYFQNNNLNFEIRAVIWAQGEADGLNSADANNYESNLLEVISEFRSLTEVPDLPFLMFRLRTDIPRAFSSTVRAAMESVAALDTNAYTIDIDDIPLIDSNIHYSMNGQITASERAFAVIQGL